MKKVSPYESIFSHIEGSVDDCYKNCMDYISVGKVIGYGGELNLTNQKWIYSKKENISRTFLFHLHAWDHIEPFFVAYDSTQEVSIFKEILNVTNSWCNCFLNEMIISDNEVKDIPENMIWYDMNISLRTYKIAYIIDCLINQKSLFSDLFDVDSLIEMYKKVLQFHFTYLADIKNLKHNNHGLYHSFCQMAAGNRLMNYYVENSYKMYIQGHLRFMSLLNKHFTTEGIHKEHSPYYHLAVCDIIKESIHLLIDNDECKHDLNLFINNLKWFVTFNKLLVNFGDTDKWDMSKYLEGETFPSNNSVWDKTFTNSGYWIVKHNYNNAKGYLGLTSVFHSRTHKHADDSSFIWHQGNKKILLDAGKYDYLQSLPLDDQRRREGFWYGDPKRIFVELSRAHNTIEIDGKSLPRVGVNPYGSGILSSGKINTKVTNEEIFYCFCSIPYLIQKKENGKIVESKIKSLHFLKYQFRLIIYFPDEWLMCIDILTGSEYKFDVKQWFNIDPRYDLQYINEHKAVFLDEECNEKLQVTSLVDSVYLKTIAKGWDRKNENTSRYNKLGWHSPDVGQLSESTSLSLGGNEKINNWKFSTFFTTKDYVYDRAFTRINESGRRGRFKFANEKKIFLVRYNIENRRKPFVHISDTQYA